jgi:hypothetical protein
MNNCTRFISGRKDTFYCLSRQNENVRFSAK